MQSQIEKAVAVCEICNGPIYNGEPVVSYDNGMAHRFKTACNHYKIEEADFLKSVGIVL